ncbi:MAG: hypothetical protein WAU45_20250 [Blastocatellia bacterium]
MNIETIVETLVSGEEQLTAHARDAAVATGQNGTLASTKDGPTAMMRTESTAILDAPRDEKTPAVEAPGLFRFSASSILSVAAPSILSALLSYMSWTAQTNVQRSVDVNSKYLSTQLSLTQDFYKKRLEAYEETYHNVALLTDALGRADFDVESKNNAMDGLVLLQRSYKKNKLYMSDNLYKGLDELWGDGIALPVLRSAPGGSGSTDLSAIQSKIDSVEKYMREDLHTEEMNKALALASANEKRSR